MAARRTPRADLPLVAPHRPDEPIRQTPTHRLPDSPPGRRPHEEQVHPAAQRLGQAAPGVEEEQVAQAGVVAPVAVPGPVAAVARRWSGRPGVGDVSSWLTAGARLVGGCCRVRPDDVAAIAAAVR